MDTPAGLVVGVGFRSDTGHRRSRNEDFVAAVVGPFPRGERRDVACAIADGMGGARGGRVAAETAVRFFLDGLSDVPETMDVQRAGARILGALNTWLHAQGREDRALAGMGCTFTALVLRGRIAHVIHAGDTRAWRWQGGRLASLTEDHAREGPGGARLLTRALGAETEIRLDYGSHPLAVHDRFLLSTDGVHAVVDDDAIAAVLGQRSAPGETADAIVRLALAHGGPDNATALVLDVLALPDTSPDDVRRLVASLPIRPLPRVGETVDGFVLRALISDGPSSRLFAANDGATGAEAALKFPKAAVGETEGLLGAFVREAWVGRHVTSPFVVPARALAEGRQSCLYTVMPLLAGETLERRLSRRPVLTLEEGRRVATAIARGAASLHRVGIVHRDIKPDNIMLDDGGSPTLLDLGVVRLPGLEDAHGGDVPGTRAYMAPEMRAGEAGDARTDQFSLAVTMFRAWTGLHAFGNADGVSPPSRDKPLDLGACRPDLPSWLGLALARAMAADPAGRFPDMEAFAAAIEDGPAATPVPARARTPYERAPVRVWQAIALLLAAALAASLVWR